MSQLLDATALPRSQAEKESWLLERLNALTEHHRCQCEAYARLLALLRPDGRPAESLAELPALPVGLFKSHRLLSIPEAEVFKVLTSSGTTGQQVSRIYLDREAAQQQAAALAEAMAGVLGRKRLPMLLVDSPATLRDRQAISARGAGLLGMMSFGRSHRFVLDEAMQLDLEGLRQFLAAYGREPFLIFGFTFMVWQYLLTPLAGLGLDLSQGLLIHSGGWKKLQEHAVDNASFKRRLREETGLARVHNFYGMVEQIGVVYLEGEDGCLYAPPFADVLIRDPVTWREAPVGSVGVIEVLSALPRSYPGHAIVTEDLGVVHGIDDAPDGRIGKRFSVLGRVPRAELRGCSDTHAYGGGA